MHRRFNLPRNFARAPGASPAASSRALSIVLAALLLLLLLWRPELWNYYYYSGSGVGGGGIIRWRYGLGNTRNTSRALVSANGRMAFGIAIVRWCFARWAVLVFGVGCIDAAKRDAGAMEGYY